MGHFLIFIKVDYYYHYSSLNVSGIEIGLWPYYSNVYYRYSCESFNIHNEIYCYLKDKFKLH